jgi:hypothetical protein
MNEELMGDIPEDNVYNRFTKAYSSVTREGQTVYQPGDYKESGVVGLRYDDFNAYDEGLSAGEDQAANRSNNQDGFSKSMRAVGRLPLNILKETVNTVGYGAQLLLNPEDTINGNIKDLDPVAKMFLDWGKDIEGVNDGIISMYTKESGVFDPTDSNWWAKTIEGWGPTFGMMVGSLGAGLIAKVPGALAKGVVQGSLKRNLRKQLGDVFEANVDDLIKLRSTKGFTDKLGEGVSDGLFNQAIKLSDDGLEKIAREKTESLTKQAVANARAKHGEKGATLMDKVANAIIDTPDQRDSLFLARRESGVIGKEAADVFEEQLKRSGQKAATPKELKEVYQKAQKEAYEDLYKIIKSNKKKKGPTRNQIDDELALLEKADSEKASVDYNQLLQERRESIRGAVDNYIKVDATLGTSDRFTQAAFASVISRNAETLGESKDTYDIVYARSRKLHPERSEEEHKEIASKAASKNYRYGMSLAAIDMLQYTKLLSMFKGAGPSLTKMNSKIKESLQLIAFDSASEGLEEGLQYTFSKNAQASRDESLIQSFLNATGDKEFWESVVQGSIGGLAFASPGYIASMLKKDPDKKDKAELLATDSKAIEAAKNSSDLQDQQLGKTADDSKNEGDDPATTIKKVVKKATELEFEEAREIVAVAQKALKADPVFGKDTEYIMTKLSLTQALNLPDKTPQQKETKEAIVKSYQQKLTSLEKAQGAKTFEIDQVDAIDGIPGVAQIGQALFNQFKAQQENAILEMEDLDLGPDLPEVDYEVNPFTENSNNGDFEIFEGADEIAVAAGVSKEEVEKYVLVKAFDRLKEKTDPKSRELLNIIAKQLGDELVEVPLIGVDGKPQKEKGKVITTLELKNSKSSDKIGNTLRNSKYTSSTVIKDYIKNLEGTNTSPTSKNPNEEHHLSKLNLDELEALHDEAKDNDGNYKLILDEIFNRSQLNGEQSIKALRLFNKLQGQLIAHESVVSFLRSMKQDPLRELLIDVIEKLGMDMEIVFTGAGKDGVYDKKTNTIYLNSKRFKEKADKIFKEGIQTNLIGNARTIESFRKKYLAYTMIKTLMRNEIMNNPDLVSDQRLIDIFNLIPDELLKEFGISNVREMLMEFGNGGFVYALSNVATNTNYSLGSILKDILKRIIELLTGKQSNAYGEAVSVLHELITGEQINNVSTSMLTPTKAKSKVNNTKSTDPNSTIHHLEIHTLPYRIVTVSNAEIEILANGDKIIVGGSFKFPKYDENSNQTVTYEELTKDYNFAITSNNSAGKYTVMLLDKNDKPLLNTKFAEEFGIDLEYYQTLDLSKEDELTVIIEEDNLKKYVEGDEITNYNLPVLKVQHNGITIGIIQGGGVDKGPLKEFRERFLNNAVKDKTHTAKIEVRHAKKGDFLKTSTKRRLEEVIPTGVIPFIKVINNASGDGNGVVDPYTIKIGDKIYTGEKLNDQTSNIIVFLDGEESGTYFIADAIKFKDHPELYQALVDELLKEDISLDDIRAIVKWSKEVDENTKISQPSISNIFKLLYTKKIKVAPNEGDIIVDSVTMSSVIDEYYESDKKNEQESLDKLYDAQESGEIFKVLSVNNENMRVEVLDMDLKPTGIIKTVPSSNKFNYYMHYVSQFMNDHNILERPVQVSLEDTYETAKDRIESNLLPKVLMAPTRLFTSEKVNKKANQNTSANKAPNKVSTFDNSLTGNLEEDGYVALNDNSRSKGQDGVYVNNGWYMVADGLGSLKDSKPLVDEILEKVSKLDKFSKAEIKSLVEEILKSHPETAGTTLSLVKKTGNNTYSYFQIGDSPIYKVDKNGKLIVIVGEDIDNSTPAAIGSKGFVANNANDLHVGIIKVKKGEHIIIGSDGLGDGIVLSRRGGKELLIAFNDLLTSTSLDDVVSYSLKELATQLKVDEKIMAHVLLKGLTTDSRRLIKVMSTNPQLIKDIFYNIKEDDFSMVVINDSINKLTPKTKSDFDVFVDTGVVSSSMIKNIANKIINGEVLTLEEIAMREEVAKEIEAILQQNVKSSVSEVPTDITEIFTDVEDLIVETNKGNPFLPVDIIPTEVSEKETSPSKTLEIVNNEKNNSKNIKEFARRYGNRLRKNGLNKTNEELIEELNNDPTRILGKLKELGLPTTDSGQALVNSLSDTNVLDGDDPIGDAYLASLGITITNPSCA